jgi:hypothetical protein
MSNNTTRLTRTPYKYTQHVICILLHPSHNEEEEQTSDHLIFQCKRLNKQRTDMIKQIKTSGGDWPTTNEKLVNNYLQIFVNFVISIDFTDLQ